MKFTEEGFLFPILDVVCFNRFIADFQLREPWLSISPRVLQSFSCEKPQRVSLFISSEMTSKYYCIELLGRKKSGEDLPECAEKCHTRIS